MDPKTINIAPEYEAWDHEGSPGEDIEKFQ